MAGISLWSRRDIVTPHLIDGQIYLVLLQVFTCSGTCSRSLQEAPQDLLWVALTRMYHITCLQWYRQPRIWIEKTEHAFFHRMKLHPVFHSVEDVNGICVTVFALIFFQNIHERKWNGSHTVRNHNELPQAGQYYQIHVI